MQRKMSFSAAVMMNINIMIGAGIFIMPLLLAQTAGSSSYLGWPMAGLLFLPVVYGIAQITKLFPEQGSFYNYSKKGIGPLAGFISGLVYFLGYVSIIALQTTGLRRVLVEQFGLRWIAHNTLLFNAAFIFSICALNFLSLKMVARIQNSGVLFKLTPIFIVLLSIPFVWSMDMPLYQQSDFSGLLMCMPIALFGYLGFESCASISHLIEGDASNASRAIILGFFTTITIYTLFHLGLLHIMGTDALAGQGVAAFASYLPFAGPLLQKLLTSLVALSICVALMSAIFGEFISNSALLQAMAEENLFAGSSLVARTTASGLPWVSLLVQATSAFTIVSLISDQYVLGAMSNFGLISTFALTLYSLLRIQRRNGAIIPVLLTLLGLASCCLLLYYSWQIVGDTHMNRLFNCVPLLLFVGGGVGMYGMRGRF